MNDFLQFVDRVPTLPNRKKITHADSSVEYATVEYADEPVETGTPLSKTGFDRLNAVLGYNDVNVEKVQKEEPVTTRVYLKSSDTSSQSNGSTYSSILATTLDGENIDFTYNLRGVSLYGDMDSSWSPSVLNNALNRTGYSSNVYVALSSTNNRLYIDFKKIRHVKIHYRIGSASNLVCKYGTTSADTSWTPESSVEKTFEFDGRYLEIKSTGSYAYIYLFYFDISDSKIVYENDFSLNNMPSLNNNQRIIIKTPNNTDLSGVASNKINDKEVSDLLVANSKYELIYDEVNDKFDIGKLSENILYDITLEQQVNQIDLTGISKRLKPGKLYALHIIGSTTSGGIVYFGNSGALNVYNYTAASMMLFVPFIENNITKCSGICNYNNPLVYYNDSISLQYESIRTVSSSYKFNIGTRIIIKEVA